MKGDIKNDNELCEAIKNSDTTKALKLLKDGANPNSKNSIGESALHLAVENNEEGIIEDLLNRGADPTYKKRIEGSGTPLHEAIYSRIAARIINLLLSNARTDINARNMTGDTPLHRAAKVGNLEAATVLLDRGADFNIKNEESKTPLDIALEHKNNNVALLIEPYIKKNNKTWQSKVQEYKEKESYYGKQK